MKFHANQHTGSRNNRVRVPLRIRRSRLLGCTSKAAARHIAPVACECIRRPPAASAWSSRTQPWSRPPSTPAFLAARASRASAGSVGMRGQPVVRRLGREIGADGRARGEERDPLAIGSSRPAFAIARVSRHMAHAWLRLSGRDSLRARVCRRRCSFCLKATAMVLDLHPIGSSSAPSLCLCTGRNASGQVVLPWVVAKRAPRRHRLRTPAFMRGRGAVCRKRIPIRTDRLR